MNDQENLVIPGNWNISYSYSSGRTAGEFLRRLRDEQKICGIRCPSCRRVLLPPRGFCERCFRECSDWVETGPGGVIEAFTITSEPFQGLPPTPYAIAYVRLDGADTAMVNFVRGVDLSDVEAAARALSIGTRVRVEWKPERQGRITDFHYRLE